MIRYFNFGLLLSYQLGRQESRVTKGNSQLPKKIECRRFWIPLSLFPTFHFTYAVSSSHWILSWITLTKNVAVTHWTGSSNNHCVKKVRIWSYSGLHFSRIFPHSDWKNADQNNSEYGLFLRRELQHQESEHVFKNSNNYVKIGRRGSCRPTPFI